MIIATIVMLLSHLRISIVVIIKAIESFLSALNISLLRSIRSELINYLIIKYYTKKRLSSNLRIY